MMKKYFCSADEYQSIINDRDGALDISKKCLTRKPGTAPYEAHKRYAETAQAYDHVLKAFTVREGSQRSPDGSLLLSTKFQMDLEEALSDAAYELWGVEPQNEPLDPKAFPQVIISYPD